MSLKLTSARIAHREEVSTPVSTRSVPALIPPAKNRALRLFLLHLGVITLFAVPSVAIFWHVWAGHLASSATCACSDAGQLIWFMAWPAYAILHGTNPFFSGAVWFPHGANLLANQSSPLIGIVMAPLTWAIGPVASANVALTLAPALSSWACWLVCRRFATWRWAPWIGGALYGYSPFVFSSIRQGHLGLAMLVVPPLIVVTLDDLIRCQGPSPWRWGLLLGLLVFAQFLISPEVLLMTVIATAIGLVAIGLVTLRSWRSERIGYVIKGISTGTGVATVLLALPLWFAIAGRGHISGPIWPGLNEFGNRLNDFVNVDSPASASSAVSFAPAGHTAAALGLTGPNAAYLGPSLLAATALSVVITRRRKITWVLLAVAIGTCTLSLGSAGLRTDALRSLHWLPWQSLVKWPLLDDILPGRFVILTDLAVSMIVALGLDEMRWWISRWVAAPVQGGASVGNDGAMSRAAPVMASFAMAAAALVPIWGLYGVPTATEAVKLPPWFASTANELPGGSVVLTYPFPASASLASEPMIWQAVDDMNFNLVGGYLKVPGPGGRPLASGPSGSAINTLINLTLVKQAPGPTWVPTPAALEALRKALSSWGVSYIVVTATGPNPFHAAALMTAITERLPQISQSAWVFDIGHRQLTQPFDASAAHGALAECSSSGESLGQKLATSVQPSQSGNRCIVDSLG